MKKINTKGETESVHAALSDISVYDSFAFTLVRFGISSSTMLTIFLARKTTVKKFLASKKYSV